MRGRGVLALCLAPVLALAIQTARADGPLLHDGFAAAIKTFAELRENLSTVVDPAARAETGRALTKLSERLDSLARTKQALTENLLSARWPQDRTRITSSAEGFKDEIRKTRFALTDVFAPLSNTWQTRGGDILTRLDSGVHGKWQSLDDAARDLGLEGASPEQFRSESEQLIAAIQQLKELVGGIASDLQK